MEVVYGGGFKDKTLRDLIVLERNGKIIVRRIRRKFTSALSFKDKYPEASVIDYTRNQYTLQSWIRLIDWGFTNPNSCPMPTFLFKGNRYYFNRVSDQWWDLPTNKYWNSRLSDLLTYDGDRKFKVELEVDHFHKHVVLNVKQKIVDAPVQPCNIRVFRNNEQIHNENFLFTKLYFQFQIEGGVDTLDLTRVVGSMANKNRHDIYCILVNGKASFYDYRGPGGLFSSIPKFLLMGMEEYEKKLGEPYRFRDYVWGHSEP